MSRVKLELKKYSREQTRVEGRAQTEKSAIHKLLMDHHVDLDSSLRDEELQILRSIYPEYISSLTEDTLRLEVPIELGTSRMVRCVDNAGGPSNREYETNIQLTHLPPVLLNIKLPPHYPTEECAAISSIHVTHSWLPDIIRLTELLQAMWAVGEGILYKWVEFIQSGDILVALDLVNSQDVIQYVESSSCCENMND